MIVQLWFLVDWFLVKAIGFCLFPIFYENEIFFALINFVAFASYIRHVLYFTYLSLINFFFFF